jgi:hypothetical protein
MAAFSPGAPGLRDGSFDKNPTLYTDTIQASLCVCVCVCVYI